MPARGKILLRKVETEESLPGGRILIPDQAREGMAQNQMLVVDIGEPEDCPWPEDCSEQAHKFLTLKLVVHPIDPRIKKGAWVIVRHRCLVDAGDGLYLARQGEILAVFSDAESESVIETSELRQQYTWRTQ